MQVSVNVVVRAGAYTVGADLMSAVVCVGTAGELNVMFWALLLLAAPLLALDVPPVALANEAVLALLSELDLEESGPTVTPPLFAEEPPLYTDELDPLVAPELEFEVSGPTVVEFPPL